MMPGRSRYLVAAVQIVADLNLLSSFSPELDGIEGPSFFQGIDSLIPYMPGRVKVRLTYTKGDHILIIHLTYQIKELYGFRMV